MNLLGMAELAADILSGVAAAQRLLGLWGPVGGASSVLGPLAAVGSLLMLAVLTGVAVSSLATLILTSLILLYVLTEVFGFSIEVSLPA